MNDVELSEPYRPRPVRFLDLVRRDGWTVKVYGITVEDERPDERLVEAATDEAFARLPRPAVAEDRYGAAVLIVHQAREGNFVLLDWWFGENMLKHVVYSSERENPADLTDISETGIAACVWELRVLGHEREAWIDAVLANPDGPDLEAYYDRRLNEDV